MLLFDMLRWLLDRNHLRLYSLNTLNFWLKLFMLVVNSFFFVLTKGIVNQLTFFLYLFITFVTKWVCCCKGLFLLFIAAEWI